MSKENEFIRILVVDDEPAVCKLLQAILARVNYNVVVAEGGVEALKMLSLGPIDLVISDALMPTMSGFDFVKALRRHPTFGQVPVLMLTRKRNRMDVKRAIEVGVTDYILKPVDEHLLLDKVELCIKKGAGKRYICEIPVTGTEAQSSINLSSRILAISETDLTLKSSVEIPSSAEFTVKSPLLDAIGVDSPVLNVIKCDRMSDNSGVAYKVKLSFVGMSETELMKIRAWIQKELSKQARPPL